METMMMNFIIIIILLFIKNFFYLKITSTSGMGATALTKYKHPYAVKIIVKCTIKCDTCSNLCVSV